MPKKKSKSKDTTNIFGMEVSSNLIFIVGIIALFVIGSKQGWFDKGEPVSEDEEDLLNNPPAYSQCKLNVNGEYFNIGDTIAGTLSGTPGEQCVIYMKDDEGWRATGIVTLNPTGIYAHSVVAETPGDYWLGSICGGDCVTNIPHIRILGSSGPSDSDGDGYSDAEENAEGTNPNDPNDHPHGDYYFDQGEFDACEDFATSQGYQSGNWDNVWDGYDCQAYATQACTSQGESLSSWEWYPLTKCCVWSCGSGTIDCDNYCDIVHTIDPNFLDFPGGRGPVADWNDCHLDGRESAVYTPDTDPLYCCCDITGIDMDGDGYTNQEEIDAGTNPNNPNDYPQAQTSCDSYCKSEWGQDMAGICGVPPVNYGYDVPCVMPQGSYYLANNLANQWCEENDPGDNYCCCWVANPD